jgi:hypothetical protein
MLNFAVLNSAGIVENCILAESLEIAENVTGLTCIQYTDSSVVSIGETDYNKDYVDGFFYAPQPYPSWTRNSGSWQPPIAQPITGLHIWNEETLSWNEVTE